MTRAWTKRVLVGCFLAGPIACVVSVNDDPIDDDIDGTSGSTNVSGSSGSGSSGTGGAGGSSGSGAQGGSLGMIENGGSGGSTLVPTPVCTPEAGDAQDECLRCIKQQCCTEWRACDDAGCQQEREDMVECVRTVQDPDAESYGDCLSMVSADMNIPQENTNTLFECVIEFVPDGDAGAEKNRCGSECFGADIYLN